MEGEPDLPAQPAEAKFLKPNLSRPIYSNPESINLSRTFNTLSTCTSTISSSSSSPPDLVRHFQAAFKRQRPQGPMQSDLAKPRRFVAPQRLTSKESDKKSSLGFDVKRNEEIQRDLRLGSLVSQSNNVVSVTGDNQDDGSITPPSEWGSTVSPREENLKPDNAQINQPGFRTEHERNSAAASSGVEPGNLIAEVQKKVHFATESNVISSGADDRMATGLDDLLSHMDSLALTEMNWNAGNQVDASAAIYQDWQHQNIQSMETDVCLRSEVGTSSLLVEVEKGVQDQPHQFGHFLQNDMNNAMTQSSVIGSSCATSTLINPTYGPMVSSTTYSLQPQIGANLGTEPTGQAEVQLNMVQPSCSSSKYAGGVLPHQSAASSSGIALDVNKSSHPSKDFQRISSQECDVAKNSHHERNDSAKGDVSGVNYQPQSSKVPVSDQKSENTKSEKQERGTSSKAASARKKGYDPDLFFKVNGKLYQRLGKIGSGGSSEVHKVISSDCSIYALKKIKLKGRDYATAYGFCQEIEYLNRLRGKNNIIQLIDYEVTDKNLLEEVMNGTMNNKDGRVKDDGYIYMVLEYGEIDLAHMLSQKRKELAASSTTIDENWLRFYWQQILQAVNTIHEERIVHSDLKPANFLLVRGSLKLIDFGIAKAIMSDTTNIQRDSQVGTLSYMSPEAFMCNETDANGNIIKCGRPSDIWSLGCILYQMVYGKTPFAEYNQFWAKFKVITDPNHEIKYEPVSNPWLLDLMKKCLAWDRNERWRIPQLLQHPFLVPPIPPKLSSPSDQSCKLLQLVIASGANDEQTLVLCSQLQDVLKDPKLEQQISRDELRKLLCKHATQCFQLQEQLANL